MTYWYMIYVLWFITYESQSIIKQKAGDMFGEIALFYSCKRTATVKSEGDVTLWGKGLNLVALEYFYNIE